MKWYSECTKWIFLLTFDKNTQTRVYNRQTDEAKKGYQDLVYQGNLLLYFINHSSIMRNLLIFKAMTHILSKSQGYLWLISFKSQG